MSHYHDVLVHSDSTCTFDHVYTSDFWMFHRLLLQNKTEEYHKDNTVFSIQSLLQ